MCKAILHKIMYKTDSHKKKKKTVFDLSFGKHLTLSLQRGAKTSDTKREVYVTVSDRFFQI